MSSIKDDIRQYILSNFLSGEKSKNLQDDTPLLRSGIIDSVAILEMIVFLEGRFGIEVGSEDASADNFGSIQDITAFVEAKRAMRT